MLYIIKLVTKNNNILNVYSTNNIDQAIQKEFELIKEQFNYITLNYLKHFMCWIPSIYIRLITIIQYRKKTKKSRLPESNWRPFAYEANALPLSQTG